MCSQVCGDIYPKNGKIIWFNMHQEPSVYINGEPVCARPPNKIGEYAELGNVTAAAIEADEVEFVRVCEGQMKASDGKMKVVNVNKVEKVVEIKTVVTLNRIKWPYFLYWRPTDQDIIVLSFHHILSKNILFNTLLVVTYIYNISNIILEAVLLLLLFRVP